MLANSKFGLNSLIECRATCTRHQASSGSFGSFVFRSIQTTNKSSVPLLSRRATTKARWRPPKITPSSFLISIHSRTSDLICGPTRVVAPERHKFCFCFSILCFSKRRVAWRPSLKPIINVIRLWEPKRIYRKKNLWLLIVIDRIKIAWSHRAILCSP